MALVEITRGSARPPLYCVYARPDDGFLYGALAHRLGPEQPVYGLTATTPDGRLEPYLNFRELAARCARELRSVQPQGPYHIVGECLAGLPAFELAAQLRADGDEVWLALIDAFRSGEPPLRSFVPSKAHSLLHRGCILGFHLLNLVRLPTRASYAAERGSRAWSKLRRRRSRADAAAAFQSALTGHEPQRYGGRVILFRAKRLPSGLACGSDLGWAEVVDELEIVPVPGYFTTAMSEPHVRVLAQKMRLMLDNDPAAAPAARLVCAGAASTFGR